MKEGYCVDIRIFLTVEPLLVVYKITMFFVCCLVGAPYLYVVDDNFFGAVDTDDSVHTARSSSACFPVFQCVLSGT